MIAYIARRLLLTIPILIGVTFLSFMILHLVPGNPALVIAGVGATPEDIQRIEQALGLNRPLLDQYGIFLRNVLQGNLGLSITSNEPVSQEIAERFPVTLTLAAASTIFAVVVGLALGMVAAAKRATLVDVGTSVIFLFALSMPTFWLGIILILVFAVKLPWLPAAGWSGVSSIILPALTLGAGGIAIIARLTRASLLETLGSDYIRTARAKGVPRAVVFVRHALRNALVPVITVIGLEFGTLLGGAVITEQVFAIPGLGRLVVTAISGRDYPTLQGAVLVIAVMVVLVNLLTDLAYALIDPRIRYA